MKKGEQPQFSAKWWKDSQPKGLKSAGGLEDALKEYESAKKKLESSHEEPDAKAATSALGGIDKAAKLVIVEASKAKGNAEMDATVDCLKKFDSNKEKNWIDANTDEGGAFSNADYREYLLKVLKQLKTKGEMNFALVLGQKAEDHRLALHPTKGSKGLSTMLVKETGIHQATCGIARTSEDPNSADDESEAPESEGDESEDDDSDENKSGKHEIVLQLEEKQLAGMAKKTMRMLKKFKVKKFKKVVLMDAAGKVLLDDDTDDTELDAASLNRALAELVRRIPGLTDAKLKDEAAQMARQANALLKGNNLPEANERIGALRTALDRAGAPANGGNDSTQGAGGSPADYTKARQIWIAARKRVEDEIEKLRAEIVATYQADGVAGDLEARYRTRVSGISTALDASLSEKLNAVAGAVDPAQRAKLIGEARGIMAQYQSYVASEPLLADLDDNPFVPLTIRQTVSTTLSALAKVVH
jgi:hypothetical protein